MCIFMLLCRVHVSASALRESWMSLVLESTDAFQSPRLSLESDLTEKSHKTSFKEQRLPGSPSPHHLFTTPPPRLSPCPASFIHQMEACKQERGYGYICKPVPWGLVRVPLFGLTPSGQGALLPWQPQHRACIPLILPQQLLLKATSLPSCHLCRGWCSPSLVSLPTRAPLIRVNRPGMATGRTAAPSSEVKEWTQFTWSYYYSWQKFSTSCLNTYSNHFT